VVLGPSIVLAARLLGLAKERSARSGRDTPVVIIDEPTALKVSHHSKVVQLEKLEPVSLKGIGDTTSFVSTTHTLTRSSVSSTDSWELIGDAPLLNRAQITAPLRARLEERRGSYVAAFTGGAGMGKTSFLDNVEHSLLGAALPPDSFTVFSTTASRNEAHSPWALVRRFLRPFRKSVPSERERSSIPGGVR
jgi:hypothetical protein